MLPQVKGASFKLPQSISFSTESDVDIDQSRLVARHQFFTLRNPSSLKGISFDDDQASLGLPRARSVHFGKDDEVQYDDQDDRLFARAMSGRAASTSPLSPSRPFTGRSGSPVAQSRTQTGRSGLRSPQRGSTGGSKRQHKASTRSPQKLRFAIQSDEDMEDPAGQSARFFGEERGTGTRQSSGKSSRRSGDEEEGRWALKYPEARQGGQAADVLDRLLGKNRATASSQQSAHSGGTHGPGTEQSGGTHGPGTAHSGGRSAAHSGGMSARSGGGCTQGVGEADDSGDEERGTVAGDVLRIDTAPASPLKTAEPPAAPANPFEAKRLWKAAAGDWKRAAEIDPVDPNMKRVGIPKKLAMGVGDVVLAVQRREEEKRREKEAKMNRLLHPKKEVTSPAMPLPQ